MPTSMTNRGAYRFYGMYLGESMPAHMWIALVTSTTIPTRLINTFNELDEIVPGNGYTPGGVQVNLDTIDWIEWIEDDPLNTVYATLRAIVWAAVGGDIPPSGNPARYAVLLDDNATINDREVWAYFDLGADVIVPDGLAVALRDIRLRGNVIETP